MGRAALGALCAVVVMVCGCASALAESPVTVGSPGTSGSPSVAVDASGNAVVAWADQQNPGREVVDWCVVAPGAGKCGHGGSLTPADGNGYVDGVQVLSDGSTLIILADVFGGPSVTYQSVQEWQSTDGGGTFAPVNGGQAVASGNPDADTVPVGGVVLPGTGQLGFAFDTASEAPTFHAFPITNPTTCGRATDACPTGYATLASTTGDQISNPSANVAANANGVLGIYATNYASGAFGCSGASPFGTAFVYGTGAQSPSNDYNVSPGAANTAWRVAATQADCGVEYPAAGAGPSGFGVIETNDATRQTQYRRFDEANGRFGKTSVVSGAIEQQPALSQDAAGDIYATYLGGGIGGPVSLSYSSDGGASWSGPASLSADPAGAIAGLTSSVNRAGQGWATWTERGRVYAQPFTSADASPPATASAARSATTDGQTVSLKLTCSTPPCRVSVALAATVKPSGGRRSTVSAALAMPARQRAKTRTLALGRGSFRLKRHTQVVTVKLSKRGHRYLNSRHGRVKLHLTLGQKLSTGTTKRTTSTVSVNVKHAAKKTHRRHR